MPIMKFIILILSLVCLTTAQAQVSVRADSTGLIIESKTRQADGVVVTIESTALDSATVRERLFNTALETYSAIARIERELQALRDQAQQLRVDIYPRFDTMNFFNRTRNLYASMLYGEYTYKQKKAVVTVEFKANAQGNPIVQTGNRRGAVRIYSTDYIEVRGFFQVGSPPVNVDVFFTRISGVWQGELDGNRITLKRKK